jgi:inorganic pyrophosphatase
VETLKDFEKINPKFLSNVIEWFKVIKTFDGKPPNRFAYDEQALSKEKTLKIIEENHEFYNKLMKTGHNEFWLK